MPLSNGRYVAPNWKNDEAPAIDAEELEAMSSTLALMGDVVTPATDMGLSEKTVGAGLKYLSLVQAQVYGEIVVTVKQANGSPAPGILFYIGSKLVTTDENGRASAIFPPGSQTVRFDAFLDMQFSPSSFTATAVKGESAFYSVVANESNKTEAKITTSKTVKFSNRVARFDLFLVGGGGEGGAVSSNNRGTVGSIVAVGGAGGFTSTVENLVNNGQELQVFVGSGGSRTYKHDTEGSGININGKAGGETKVTREGVTLASAKGGDGGDAYWHTSNNYTQTWSGASGGSGSGAVETTDPVVVGNSGYNGGDGSAANTTSGGKGQGTTTTAFREGTGTQYSPAGGSCGSRTSYNNIPSFGTGSVGPGGAPATTKKTSSDSDSIYGRDAYVPGGGGGAAALSWDFSTYSSDASVTSGAGADGLVIVRWRYK